MSQGKGRGIFAKRNFFQGETILIEKSFALCNLYDEKDQERHMTLTEFKKIVTIFIDNQKKNLDPHHIVLFEKIKKNISENNLNKSRFL